MNSLWGELELNYGYEIIKPLDDDSGRVYQALNKANGCMYAVKLYYNCFEDQEVAEELYREI